MNDTVAPLKNDDLNTWLDYWGRVHVTGIDLGLERVIPVAEALGVVRPKAKVMTTAGTNGKGSTTTTIASILQAEGYHVGLYQSPHVYRFNERVKLNGIEVEDHLLIDAFVQVDHARRACGLSLSFFEATTLAAFVIFKDQACDVWVLEVGLGGRLDVVNVVDANVAVITNIGLDHIDWLGDTIEKIAFEKAGIIRDGIPVVFGSQQRLPDAIQQKAAQHQATLTVAGQDYFHQLAEDGQSWYYASSGVTLNLPLPKLAVENVATALTAVLQSELRVTQKAIEQGILNATLAGRFDVRQIQNKTVIFDAGHNPHGVAFLLNQLQQYLQTHAQFTKVRAVFSMLADKDVEQVVQLLKPHITSWAIAPLEVPRAAPIEQLLQALVGQSVNQFDRIACAFENTLQQPVDDELILVCGSFHTLEAVWEYLLNVNEQ